MVTDNELASKVGRATNSALTSLLLSLMALVIMFVKEHKTFLCSKKKKKKGTQKKVLVLGIEMRLIKSKSNDLWKKLLTLLFVLNEIMDFHV